jgi:prevent-host-death family protein
VPDDFDRMGQHEIGLVERDASPRPAAFFARADSQRMKVFTITAARRRFGAMLDSALRGPILITRRNKTGAVIMSAEQYDRMAGATSFEPESAKLTRGKTGSSKRH